MTDIKLIKQLPKLDDHHEWGCSSGCSLVTPKLHRHIYAESWNTQGVKIRELAEHYYTCELGHLLEVWDTETHDYVVLAEEAYTTRENRFNFNLDHIEKIREELNLTRNKHANKCITEMFHSATVTLECTLADGSVVSITHEYLNEIEASLKEELIVGGAQ